MPASGSASPTRPAGSPSDNPPASGRRAHLETSAARSPSRRTRQSPSIRPYRRRTARGRSQTPRSSAPALSSPYIARNTARRRSVAACARICLPTRQRSKPPEAASPVSASACTPPTPSTRGSVATVRRTETPRRKSRTRPAPSPEFLKRQQTSSPSSPGRSSGLSRYQTPWWVRQFHGPLRRARG